MSDGIIERATEVAEDALQVEYGGYQYPAARTIARALADAGLLRPEVTDEMVERAARVLFEESQELDQDNSWDDDLPDDWRNEWRYVAREALDAALGVTS